jgi:hypothetical protein
VLLLALLAAGCRSPAPTFDPFAGRTTVPPPGTGTGALTPPTVTQPYYQSAPPPGMPSTAPMNTAPPGGYGFPQGANSLPASTPSAFAAQEPAIRVQDGVAPLAHEPPPSLAMSEAVPLRPRINEPQIAVPTDSATARIAPPATMMPQNIQAAPLATNVQPQMTPAPLVTAITPGQQTLQPYATTVSPIQRPAPVSYTIVSQPQPQPQFQPNPCYAAPAIMLDECGCTPSQVILSSGAVEISELPSRATHGVRNTPTLAPPENSIASTTASNLVVRQVSHVEPIKADFQPQKIVSRYGFDTEYQWIRGKLEYLQSTGQWKLRYIPVDGDTDEYGGSVEIANPDAVAAFEPGDHVTLHGHVSREPDDAGAFAPLYTVERANRVQ